MENYENNNITEEESVYGQDFANNQTKYVSKEEFMNNHVFFNKNIKMVVIISYILIGLNAIAIINEPIVIVELGVLLGCALGVHLKKSKTCAMGVLVFGIINTIAGLSAGTRPSGWMWVIFGILYLTQFNRVDKEYNELYGA